MLAKLRKKGIFSEEVIGIIEDMKGFKNILVHEYAVIDAEIVFEILNTRIGDFQMFKAEIINSLH